ncbi:hypothetical protein QR680_018463 [Steinernema hermaphroditum]|uniref:Uncharacterized protein n=1 Tax=Steinernema hermaphroditum TaxID=289476 RepID=A0AA39HK56_9BILA|nr:hypothetical protein QR680_018463 [Steinernema hermaphroditum]
MRSLLFVGFLVASLSISSNGESVAETLLNWEVKHLHSAYSKLQSAFRPAVTQDKTYGDIVDCEKYRTNNHSLLVISSSGETGEPVEVFSEMHTYDNLARGVENMGTKKWQICPFIRSVELLKKCWTTEEQLKFEELAKTCHSKLTISEKIQQTIIEYSKNPTFVMVIAGIACLSICSSSMCWVVLIVYAAFKRTEEADDENRRSAKRL